MNGNEIYMSKVSQTAKLQSLHLLMQDRVGKLKKSRKKIEKHVTQSHNADFRYTKYKIQGKNYF